jgi:DNA polymerase IV
MTSSKIIMLSSWPRAIVHVDGDAFFAACEQAVHPEYQGKPVVTGKERGIVAAASYEAKARGVARGVPLWDVKKLCPDCIIVPSDYETYSLFSKRLFQIMRRFTSQVEEYSIDEGFADLTGLRRPFHSSYENIARQMQQTIQQELGLTVSVGLSLTKVLAKIASKYQKPSGFTVIKGRDINKYLATTPIIKIWGVGSRTASYCAKLGLRTALEFAQQTEAEVKKRFTKPHYEIWQELRGELVYPVVPEEKSVYASISKTKTFTPPSSDPNYVFAQLLKNLENACIKARHHCLLAQGLVIFLKRQDFSHAALEIKLSRASAYPPDMVLALRRAFAKLFKPQNQYRATGAVLIGLTTDAAVQTSLFEEPLRFTKLRRIYEAMDSLAERFGKHAVHLAASASAHGTPQHVKERGDVPLRKQQRIKGETGRIHLNVPFLLGKLK